MDVDSDMGYSHNSLHPRPPSRPSAASASPAHHHHHHHHHHHSHSHSPTSAGTSPTDHSSLVIRNVHLPFDSDDPTLADPLYNVYCVGGRVDRVELASANGNGHGSLSRHSTPPHHPEYHQHQHQRDRQPHAELDAQGRGILLPALCHAHIHLDKCFLLDQCDELVTGNFSEALRVTTKAKSAFPHNPDDLYDRGRKLITQSVECGVTMMRAHVEVDEVVHLACLDAGLRLRKHFKDVCDVQIAAFAQDPLFASTSLDDRPGLNLVLLQSAARRPGVEAVGSAPYVEHTFAHAKRNIEHILDLASDAGLHADFHLDYNLEPGAEPLIWHVLDQLRARIAHGRWGAQQRVCVGHATRLTLFGAEEWARVRAAVVDERLPVSFVALPPSDLYMMGRGAEWRFAPRGTLNVPRLADEWGLRVAMAVNNVENAFTPQGPVDPLSLCPLGVAVFQAGTKKDCRALLESVTLNARLAIGAIPHAHKLASLSSSGRTSPHSPHSSHTHSTHSHPPSHSSHSSHSPPHSHHSSSHSPSPHPSTSSSASSAHPHPYPYLSMTPTPGTPADFVLLHENDSVHGAALNPSFSRTTIRHGVVVARRVAQTWVLPVRTPTRTPEPGSPGAGDDMES